MAKVSIASADRDLYTTVNKVLDDLGERFVTSGDRVLIKPNLVYLASPDSGEITNVGLIEAVARYCLDCGASRVIIGEGPGQYQPRARLRECFTHTGVSELTRLLGVEWVLFDEHDYRTFREVSDCTPREFRITEFAFDCDKFINLPALKTHYLTTVTLAMKNLKGCLKWEDKPFFHQPDLPRAVVELNKIIRPTLNIIDGTHWKKDSEGVIIAGSDVVAVDTVGCAIMGIDPAQVRTIQLGAAAGLGENDITRIDIVGEELKRLKFRVKLPQEELQQYFPMLTITGADKACSGCLIPLISTLMAIGKKGANMKQPLVICLGKEPVIPENGSYLLVGDCATRGETQSADRVDGCPPDRDILLERLNSKIRLAPFS